MDGGTMYQKAHRYLIEFFITVVIALILTMLIRTFIAEAREIPTGSMLPTIQVGDIIMVEKVSVHFAAPSRGDIVVFAPPPSAHAREDYIKRVVALPGDLVEIRNNKLFVDKRPVNESYLLDKKMKDLKPTVVPKGHLFVLGDNRNNSFDSRNWGFLPIKNLKGTAWFRFWPFERAGSI